MLDQALRVVEAARALKLERKGKLSGSAITDRLALANAIDGLRDAIEDFDRETAQGLGAPTHHIRPDFATPPQLDEHGFIEKQDLIETKASMPGMAPEPQFEPEDDAPELDDNLSVTRAFSPSVSIPASSAAAGMAYLNHTADLGDMEFNDGTESVADFLEGLDMISDKLEYLVAKVGWSPRLRALAAAANVAKGKMFLEVSHEGSFIRIPAHSWSTMSVALADAVMDRDNKITAPMPPQLQVPGPRLDNGHAPRPPGY